MLGDGVWRFRGPAAENRVAPSRRAHRQSTAKQHIHRATERRGLSHDVVHRRGRGRGRLCGGEGRCLASRQLRKSPKKKLSKKNKNGTRGTRKKRRFSRGGRGMVPSVRTYQDSRSGPRGHQARGEYSFIRLTGSGRVSCIDLGRVIATGLRHDARLFARHPSAFVPRGKKTSRKRISLHGRALDEQSLSR